MAMRMFWVVKGRHSEGRHWMDQALERGIALQPTMRARALYALACCIYGSGDNERLLAVSTESSELFRRAGDRYGEALGLSMIGFARILLGDHDHATAALQDGLAIFRSLDNHWASTHLLYHLTPIARSRGDLALAARYDEEALALARQTGDVLATYATRYSTGRTAFESGDLGRAATFFTEALAGAHQANDPVNTAYGLRSIAAIVIVEGDPEQVGHLIGTADAQLASLGTPRYAFTDDAAMIERTSATARAALGAERWEAALARGRAMPLSEAVALALAEGHANDAR
jgi:non-specific serine/threonine protein kinase